MRHRHAGRGALPGQADDVFGADVGSEYGGADGDEAGITARQKLIDAILLMSAVPPGHGPDEEEVQDDDDPVERSQNRGLHTGPSCIVEVAIPSA
jgi:hypothetical protein